MSNSEEDSLASISVKLEYAAEASAESRAHQGSGLIRTDQNAGDGAPASDTGNVEWIKNEPPNSAFVLKLFGMGGGQSRIKEEVTIIDERVGVGEYVCFYCQEASDTLCTLKKHIRKHHSNLYKSGASTESLDSEDTRDHKRRGRVQLLSRSKKKKALRINSTNLTLEGNSYPCPKCYFLAQSAGSLRKHITAKHTVKPFGCPYCEYTTGKRRNLKPHILARHTNERPHRCPKCEYSATQKTTLNTHMRAKHEDRKPFVCGECGFSTSQSGHLKTHIRAVHTKEKPFSCPHCVYRTLQASTLKSHIASFHSDDKPHSCVYCPYKSVSARNLKRHFMARHTDDKPFSCMQCPYKTTQRGHLKYHIMAKHIKQKPFFCSLCDYSSTGVGCLRRHIRLKHAEDKPRIVPQF